MELVCTIKESLAALHIQRLHKTDKDDRCTEFSVVDMFLHYPFADTGPGFAVPSEPNTPELSTSVSGMSFYL